MFMVKSKTRIQEMIQKQLLKALDRSVLIKLVLSISIFDIAQCNGNNVEVKQSSIIRDFHVPKYVIEGETVELHCGVTRDGWSILDSLRWYKDEHLIFSHKPHDEIQTKIYPYDSSIPIDMVTYYFLRNRSKGRKVVLMIKNANTNGMCGNYKCEVSLRHTKGQTSYQVLEQSALDAKYQERDRNHFTGRREGQMNVMENPGTENEISFPEISDRHDVKLSNYTEGSMISLTCESSKMKPAPSLAWYFKAQDTENTTGEETLVPMTSLKQYPVRIFEIGFEQSRLGINIKLNDFDQRLLCIAQSAPTCTSPITKRGTAIDLKTREFQQYTYIDQPDEPEEEAAPVVVTCPASPSDSEMILAKALFTFLLSTTVVTFALLFVLFLFGTYYLYLVIIRKKKISCNWLLKKRTNRKISTMSAMSTTSSIIKSNKNMGFCEHCKGPCCTNPMKRQSTLRRGPTTMRSGGTINSAKNSDYFNLSSLSRIGSWKNSFYTPNRISNYNQSDQYNYADN